MLCMAEHNPPARSARTSTEAVTPEPAVPGGLSFATGTSASGGAGISHPASGLRPATPSRAASIWARRSSRPSWVTRLR